SFIGERCFWHCDKLEKFILPASVEFIGKDAFDYCDNLTLYTPLSAKPDGWHEDFNFGDAPIIWNYKD
ncbi:MAG: leucine-rich repeat protein, partial [Clostridia bacterium]|nr:leucine-rich repeat protein [Clostridia bacterium]